jgi:hypothetical protein
MFVAGRACFAAGYATGAPARAAGFLLTMLPTSAMLAMMAARLLVCLIDRSIDREGPILLCAGPCQHQSEKMLF